ncbi:MAG: hypothetical protein OHK0046_07490 [Anaerolineae bacterium]
MDHTSAPPPDLRIIRVDSAHPHEEHDSQRSAPLMSRLQAAEFMINPPVVAPMGASQFVILDGANRFYAFQSLHYPHILVQVVSYDSGYVDLQTWQHVISGWDEDQFLTELHQLKMVKLVEGQDADSIAHILFRSGHVVGICCPVETTHERNEVLRQVVSVYQRHARLNRTAIHEPQEIWLLYPEAFGFVLFPRYTPNDIIAAAKYKAFLPPGISRHIVHGRALRVNYPMALLRDENTRLADKNAALVEWVQAKLANRAVRYYAEATYQFDE